MATLYLPIQTADELRARLRDEWLQGRATARTTEDVALYDEVELVIAYRWDQVVVPARVVRPHLGGKDAGEIGLEVKLTTAQRARLERLSTPSIETDSLAGALAVLETAAGDPTPSGNPQLTSGAYLPHVATAESRLQRGPAETAPHSTPMDSGHSSVDPMVNVDRAREARQFFDAARAAWRENDVEATLSNLRLAAAYDPGCAAYRDAVARLGGRVGAPP